MHFRRKHNIICFRFGKRQPKRQVRKGNFDKRTKIKLALGEYTEKAAPDGMQDGQTPPTPPDGDSNGGTPPEKPENDGNAHSRPKSLTAASSQL